MHGALQAGQRGFFLFVNGIMTSINSIKDTDTPRLLLLGLLLPSVLVPSVGTQSASSPPIPPSTSTSNTSTQSPTSAPTVATGNQGGSSTQPAITTNPTTAIGPSPTASTTQSPQTYPTSASYQPPTSTMGTATTMTIQTATATPDGTAVTNAQSSTTPSGVGSSMMSSAMTASSASQAPVTGSMSSMMSTDQTTAASGMTTMDVSNSDTTTAWTPMLYCPSFICNNSDCYTMYTSQNTTACNSTCQLWRMDMYHTVDCSSSCADSCVNASQINCSVNCCNYTGCLNDSFAMMMMTTTTGNATTTTMVATPTPVMTTTTQSTTADKRNKCHNGTCEGTDCYTGFKNNLQSCSSQHPHCQLKKEASGSKIMWKAGCTNCTIHTACKASTTPPCNLECCNATMTSCLMLNGTLNVPSFAPRGLCVHTELIASLLGLLAITLLL